jgi:hypothetical protein
MSTGALNAYARKSHNFRRLVDTLLTKVASAQTVKQISAFLLTRKSSKGCDEK